MPYTSFGVDITLDYLKRAEFGRYFPAEERIVDRFEITRAVAEAEERRSRATSEEERNFYRECSEVFGFVLERYSNFDAVDAINRWPKVNLRVEPAATASEPRACPPERAFNSPETRLPTQAKSRPPVPRYGSAGHHGVIQGRVSKRRPVDVMRKDAGSGTTERPR
ncbi:hypothetical protein FJU08_19865 [Martelella alba]|uniref:Uncharacterized protein n=1 Tax=Martelella alba TaxID=2590451 RepID=A0A506U390_9HYPH|nr:hypothetical protein [Martelella alba]TPW27475.1 hypothetical protein FJU08_19865 [Martelella alba]